MRLVALLAVALVSSCTCGEPPPSAVVDAGLIGDGDPVDPDAGPPYERDAGPVVCEDDSDEDNDVRADAVVVSGADPVLATVCGDDDDWYAVQTTTGCAVTVDLRFDAADGDLDVLMFDPDGQLVGSAQSLDDHEALNVTATRDGSYAVRVRGGSREIVPYALRLTEVCAADLTCPADDPREDNDSTATASVFDTGVSVDGIVCAGDQDLFLMPVASGCIADMTLDFVDSEGDIDVELLRADGSILGASRSTTDQEHIKKVASEVGLAYRVVLFGNDDGNRYRLRVDQICEGQLACPLDDPFEPNDSTSQPVRVDAKHDQVLGVLCGTDGDFFDLLPQTGCRMSAVLELDTTEGDLDLELLSADGTRISLSNSTTSEEHLDYDATSGARVLLHPFSFANPNDASQGYRLTVTTSCD